MRYQLISKRKTIAGKSTPDYPLLHLHSIPTEILSEIIANISNKTDLAHFGETCRRFHNLVRKQLYRDLYFTSDRFIQFSLAHLPLVRKRGIKEPSQCVSVIQLLYIDKPPGANTTTQAKIAGAYGIESTKTELQYDIFVQSLRVLLDECYGLQRITLDEVATNFSFPPSTKSKLSFRKVPKAPQRRLSRLTLKTQSGWSLPWRISHISAILDKFETIDNLELVNFIIDDDIETSEYSTRVNQVTFVGCKYLCKRKLTVQLFEKCRVIYLPKITNQLDLSLIDFVRALAPNLEQLILNMESLIFYVSIDGNKRFNFLKYNPFFRLVCLGEGRYSTINHVVLRNFDLAECVKWSGHTGDEWVVDDNGLTGFLRDLAAVPRLTIEVISSTKVCVKCGQEDKSTEHANWHRVLGQLQKTKLTIIGPNNKILFKN